MSRGIARDHHLQVIWLLAAAALLWVAILAVAPFLPVPASAAVYALGSLICHQRPERSFELAGHQLPVCARCIGIYGGAALGALLAPFIGQVRRPRRAILIAIVPALVSLVVEWVGIARPSNSVRALTGLVGGAVIAAAVLATLHYEQCAPPRPIAANPPRTRI